MLAGVLGGAAITIGFAILVAGAPPARRGRVMATVTAVQMSAGAIGSFLGGLVLTWFPLEVVFLVASVPLALVLAWDALRPAAHYWLPRGRPRRRRMRPARWSSPPRSSPPLVEPSRPADAVCPQPRRWSSCRDLDQVETPPHTLVELVETPRANLASHPAASAPSPARPATPAWASPRS